MTNRKDFYKVTGIVLLIDQLIKIIINHTMKLHQSLEIIPNFFSIFFVKNTGAAFSIFSDSTLLLIIISTIFILALNRFIVKDNSITKKEELYLGLVMGGVLGNLIDRIIHKGVIDYLSFTFFDYDFAVFNFADSCIVIGTLLYLISSFIKRKDK